MARNNASIVNRLIDGACRAQAMSDASGETYSIEGGITGLKVIGRYSGHTIMRAVGYGELEDFAENPLLDALELVRLDLRSHIEKPEWGMAL